MPYDSLELCILHEHSGDRDGLTLNSLGTISLGVSTPTSISTPQKMRMARMMAKSLMSFLTWVKVNTKTWRSCFL